MASQPYDIWRHMATVDYERNGRRAIQGDVIEFWVTDWPKEKIEKYKAAGKDIRDYAAAVFYVNKENTEEEQQARAKVFCNYMNKLKEAEERAKAGVEMGFLK